MDPAGTWRKMTPYHRRSDVMTSHQRRYDVIFGTICPVGGKNGMAEIIFVPLATVGYCSFRKEFSPSERAIVSCISATIPNHCKEVENNICANSFHSIPLHFLPCFNYTIL